MISPCTSKTPQYMSMYGPNQSRYSRQLRFLHLTWSDTSWPSWPFSKTTFLESWTSLVGFSVVGRNNSSNQSLDTGRDHHTGHDQTSQRRGQLRRDRQQLEERQEGQLTPLQVTPMEHHGATCCHRWPRADQEPRQSRHKVLSSLGHQDLQVLAMGLLGMTWSLHQQLQRLLPRHLHVRPRPIHP